MPDILYSGKPYKNIIFNISIKADFNEILKKLDSLSIDMEGIDQEMIKYAILELVNNSLRAHREKKVQEKIILHFSSQNNDLFVRVKDKGGGFDKSKLPYDVNSEPSQIDVNSDIFQEYREKFKYQRFGMGLLVGKKVFPFFKIRFYNAMGNDTDWIPGQVSGTIIDMRIGGNY